MKEEKVEKTPSGLLVVTEAEREADALLKQMEILAAEVGLKKRKVLRWVGSRHHDVLGIDIKTEARMETPHKLNEEQRKQRRTDNRAMAEIRKKTRKRRKHGR